MKLLPLVVLVGGAYLYFTSQAAIGGNAVGPDVAATPVPDFNDGIDTQGYYLDANLTAFLATIRRSDAGDASAAGYGLFYGGSTFSDFSDHPCITGEKAGVKLPDEWCRKAGLSPGCVSTAAGGYQITKPTWIDVRQDKGDGFGYLPDFTPASQDVAAIRLLRASGALDHLTAGDFDGAVALASTRWASLAGSTSGQPQHALSSLLAWFSDFGGAVA